LDAVSRIEPDAVADLLSSEGVAAARRRMRLVYRTYLDAPDTPENLLILTFCLSNDRELGPHVRAWARRWNLTPNWCGRAAYNVLARAALAAERHEPLPVSLTLPEWLMVNLRAVMPRAVVPVFAYANWREFPPTYAPCCERRVDAKRRIMTMLETMVDDELDRREAASLASGARPTAPARAVDHFEWLVRYQVRGVSYNHIAQATGRSRQAVTEAIAETAEFLDLPLRRSSPGGRPRLPRRRAHTVKVPSQSR